MKIEFDLGKFLSEISEPALILVSFIVGVLIVGMLGLFLTVFGPLGILIAFLIFLFTSCVYMSINDWKRNKKRQGDAK